MEISLTEIIEIIKGSNDGIDAERKLQVYFSNKISDIMQLILEYIDDGLAEEYKKQGYRIEKRDLRTIQFLFGKVTFKRRRMKKEMEKALYPLDKEMGFISRETFSPLLLRNIAEIASGTVLRKTAQATALLTPFTISHTKVKAVLDTVGEFQQNYTENHLLDVTKLTEPKEKKNVPFLYIEGDGLMYKEIKKKRGEIHRIQIAEGVEKNGKRTRLTGTHYFSSTDSTEVAWSLVQNYLYLNYDLTNTLVISNSDGGSGYEFDKFNAVVQGCLRHEHVRDTYHVNQKIKQRLNFVPELQSPLKKAIQDHEREAVSAVLDTAESIIGDEQAAQLEEQIRRLRGYLSRNWEYLTPIYKRGLGEAAHGIGTCESNHRPYSYRVKGQGKYWSKKGLTHVVYVIEGLKNGTLDRAIIEQQPEYKKQASASYKAALKAAHKKVPHQTHEGVRHGSIPHVSRSSSTGNLSAIFNY
ncbi:ISLre2 family transposase [Carnobacterium mobile]|uniref:ISLre2 family transposase n=1 Tax=Carnobacterium mobile TaxID=2750 RepID=UPI00068A73B7|nr:ISLre2 family transposase [Carnobacterium mobile]